MRRSGEADLGDFEELRFQLALAFDRGTRSSTVLVLLAGEVLAEAIDL
jgi:hypothetical protein